MSKFITLIILVLFTKSLVAQEEATVLQNYLASVSNTQKLLIVFYDDKCGEWGGNEIHITLYRDWIDRPLLADIIEKTMDCEHLERKKKTKKYKRIPVTGEDATLVYSCIQEISTNMLDRGLYFPSSGPAYGINFDDKLVIRDVGYKRLISFDKLYENLKGRIKKKPF